MTRLGIHTEVPNPGRPARTHAWLSLEKDGVTKTYSLYHDDHIRAHDNGQSHGWNGSGTHVRENVDLDKILTASRFMNISPEQERRLVQSLSQPERFDTFENTCCHFAARTWENTTGEHLEVKHPTLGPNDQYFTVESPVGLEQSIRSRNLEQTTSQEQAPAQADPQREAERPLTFAERKAEADRQRAEMHRPIEINEEEQRRRRKQERQLDQERDR